MPDLVVIVGPPASGKAAIGLARSELTGFRFFHKHLTAEPVATFSADRGSVNDPNGIFSGAEVGCRISTEQDLERHLVVPRGLHW